MTHKTALLVIDAQTGIIEGPDHGPVYQKSEVLKIMQTLIKQAREQIIPVVYVQDIDVAPQGTKEFDVHPDLAPLEGEPVFLKQATDAFYGTSLHEELQALGIDHLVVVGCKTQFCVDTACRTATTLGYDVTLVRDGHSSTDTTILKADQIIAHHNTSLHGFGNVDHFILVRGSGENVFEPTHDQYR